MKATRFFNVHLISNWVTYHDLSLEQQLQILNLIKQRYLSDKLRNPDFFCYDLTDCFSQLQQLLTSDEPPPGCNGSPVPSTNTINPNTPQKQLPMVRMIEHLNTSLDELKEQNAQLTRIITQQNEELRVLPESRWPQCGPATVWPADEVSCRKGYRYPDQHWYRADQSSFQTGQPNREEVSQGDRWQLRDRQRREKDQGPQMVEGGGYLGCGQKECEETLYHRCQQGHRLCATPRILGVEEHDDRRIKSSKGFERDPHPRDGTGGKEEEHRYHPHLRDGSPLLR